MEEKTEKRLFKTNKNRLEMLKKVNYKPYDLRVFASSLSCFPNYFNVPEWYKIQDDKRQRNLIKLFKRKIERYNFCMLIKKNSFHAEIGYKSISPILLKEDTFIFSNIAIEDFEIVNKVYEKEEIDLIIHNHIKILTVFEQLGKRRYKKREVASLRSYILHGISISYNILKEFKNKKIAEEFYYRYILIDFNVYKINNYKENDYDLYNVDKLKGKITDKFSYENYNFFKRDEFERIEYILSLIARVVNLKYLKQNRDEALLRAVRKFYLKAEIRDKDIDLRRFKKDLADYILYELKRVSRVFNSYEYLIDYYSPRYREEFNNLRKQYTLYRTQKILRYKRSILEKIDILSIRLFKFNNGEDEFNIILDFLLEEKSYRDNYEAMYGDDNWEHWEYDLIDYETYKKERMSEDFEEYEEYDDMLEVEYRLNEYEEDLFSEISSMEEKLSKIEGIDLHKLASNEDEEPLELEEHYEAVLEEYNKYFS